MHTHTWLKTHMHTRTCALTRHTHACAHAHKIHASVMHTHENTHTHTTSTHWHTQLAPDNFRKSLVFSHITSIVVSIQQRRESRVWPTLRWRNSVALWKIALNSVPSYFQELSVSNGSAGTFDCGGPYPWFIIKQGFIITKLPSWQCDGLNRQQEKVEIWIIGHNMIVKLQPVIQ